MLDAIRFVCETAKYTQGQMQKENLVDYRDKQGIGSRQIVWEGIRLENNNHVNPHVKLWWRGLRGTCELAEVAIKILGALVTP